MGREFSKRLDWTVQSNAISKRVAERPPQVDLTGSNPTRAGFHYSQDLLQAFTDVRGLQYDPDPRGLADVRSMTGADLLTASSSESYSYILKLLCDPGDEILVPRPSYPLFDFLAHLDSVVVKQYPLFYDHGWHIDTAALRARCTDRTKAVVVVNPNNPTGSFLKRRELQDLEEIGLPILSDEVFAPYALGEDETRVECVADVSEVLSFSLGGLSKQAGLPQMKLGWIRVGGRERQRAIDALELIADTYLSVSTPVQLAAGRLLAANMHEQIQARVKANLALVSDAALIVEGGWSAILRLPAIRSEEEWILHLLDEHGVYVQPGFFFDFESGPYAVLSLITPPESFQEGVSRIRRATNLSHS
jgi:alanine-synthesizing transaminase